MTIAIRCACTALAIVALAAGQRAEPAQRAGAGSGARPARALPARLDQYVRAVAKLTPSEITALSSGAPVVKLLDPESDHEVAVFGANWIDAPPERYIAAVNDIERFERGGGFLTTHRISDPPRLEDFAPLVLRTDDLAALRACRMDDCDVKLSQPALQQLQREVDWSKPDSAAAANAFMRRRAHEFVTGYLEGGNARLGVYRDSAHPTFVANEFKAMIDKVPELVGYMPDLQRYLLEYPKTDLPGATSFLYWQEVDFGLKPTLRINHVVIRPHDTEVVVATKMLYASHYFWTALDLRMLVPDPGRGKGFWFVTLARSRSDGLTGFTGWFIKRRVRSGARDGALQILRATKSRLEQPERGR